MFKKILKIVLIVLGVVLLLAAILYINIKSFTVKRINPGNGQDVYLMGTFHVSHFDKMSNYSIEEMVNAIKNIDPDAVFIEARENYFDEYGVVDGPVDMCITYAYCKANGIPVELIDYWEVTNESYKKNTTTDDRDDHIHKNIMDKLGKYENKKVLIVCGFGHLYPQTDRLKAEGYKEESVSHAGKLFKGSEGGFSYPPMVSEIWEQRAEFYAHIYPELIQADASIDDDVKAQWPVDVNNSYYNSQVKYCELFKANELYK